MTSENISELDARLAQAPMRLANVGIDLETKLASLIIMSSLIRKLGH